MQGQNKNFNQQDIDKDFKGGSNITDQEEKEARKHDDWRAHRHEKHRDLKEEFRAGELHGAVGKEIEEVIEKDKPRMFKHQNLDYGNDIYNDKPINKSHPGDFNNKGLDQDSKHAKLANQEADKNLDKLEHQKHF